MSNTEPQNIGFYVGEKVGIFFYRGIEIVNSGYFSNYMLVIR